ncbi:metal-dependent hydrolase [Candidatus Dependentiae bacterium]
MPGYKAHMVGGLAVYGITIYLLRSYCGSAFIAAEWLLFTLVGSLFPDIDTKSKGQMFLYQILFITLIILAIQRKFVIMAFLSVAAIVPIIARHRGLFHKPWFVVSLPAVVALGVSLYAPAYTKIIVFDAIFFILGALSHLVMDFAWSLFKRRCC